MGNYTTTGTPNCPLTLSTTRPVTIYYRPRFNEHDAGTSTMNKFSCISYWTSGIFSHKNDHQFVGCLQRKISLTSITYKKKKHKNLLNTHHLSLFPRIVGVQNLIIILIPYGWNVEIGVDFINLVGPLRELQNDKKRWFFASNLAEYLVHDPWIWSEVMIQSTSTHDRIL